MAALGLAVLLAGLSGPNTIAIVVGASDMGLGICFLLLEPFASYSVTRLNGTVSEAERIQADNSGP